MYKIKTETIEYWSLLIESGSDCNILLIDRHLHSQIAATCKINIIIWISSTRIFMNIHTSHVDIVFPEYITTTIVTVYPDLQQVPNGTNTIQDLVIGTQRTMQYRNTAMCFCNGLAMHVPLMGSRK